MSKKYLTVVFEDDVEHELSEHNHNIEDMAYKLAYSRYRIAELEAQLIQVEMDRAAYKRGAAIAENQLKTESERLDIILSQCFIRNNASITVPYNYRNITDDDKQESLRQLDKAIHSLEGKK